MNTPTHPPSSSFMLTHLILYLMPSLLLLLHFFSLVAGAPPYTPTEYILLDCGSSTKTTSPDDRNWEGDAMSKFSPSDLQKTSSSSTASEQDPSVTQVPYKTARLFHSQFTYTFPVSPGPKFLRLYFYPATYPGFDISTSFFSVFANSYAILKNFSASLTVSAIQPPVHSFIKEFCINVLDIQRLNITFTPSPSSFAFVNGIEIVSMPYNLYMDHTDDNPIKLVRQKDYTHFYNGNDDFTLDNNTAFETLYRLNVGGEVVSVNDDTGMSRTWSDDLVYIFGQASGTTPHRSNATIHYTPDTPAYTAPEIVYTTSRTMGNYAREVNMRNNLTWIFTIDSGFSYLVRLHFCETQLEVTRPNQRVFDIYINNQTAQEDMDVIQLSGGTGFPVYRDFVVLVPDQHGSRSKQDLWLALHPSIDSTHDQFADVILNGLEIFKLNLSDGSLAGPNPDKITVDPPEPHLNRPEKSKSKGSSPIIVITGAVLGCGVALSILCLLIYWKLRRVKVVVPSSISQSTKEGSSSLPSDLCRKFSIVEIKTATCNFHDNFIIGAGGFGNVYKGYIDGGSTAVAIKRLNPLSRQGAREFQAEIMTLSQVRHLHLVSLIGYCDDDDEMILVYDYMAQGTLRDHLYSASKNLPLPWKQRLEICIGAAKGLHYLHTGAKHTVIHRDVKSSNILLDEKWGAKVSDFGLSKMGPINTSHAHVSTAVKGSFGYIDPEYYRRKQLTEKSDVYSFGVVLFEVLCGRPAVIREVSKEQVNLAEWARNCYEKGTLDQIMDPNLRGEIAPECLKKFGEIADSCVRDHGILRPTMFDVLWTLEFALQLQVNAEKINGTDHAVDLSHIETRRSKTEKSPVIAVDGGKMNGATLHSLFEFFNFRQRRMNTKPQITNQSSLPQELCRHFTLAEIQTATSNFNRALIIGDGGFGRVYKGYIDHGRTPVAIKRLKRKSLQGALEFWTEIKTLSRLRHLHLVSLIGYCNEKRQMILVYDYMARGTLREHLYKADKPSLSWKQRLEICIGAARGLDYLHAGAEHTIIHRDVKTTNILLDENWIAKVSDFGLSKMGPTTESRSHVSTIVKGTFGYLDPQYYWSRQLTVKSDVYSFGVVLFEVLCGRAAVDIELEEEQHGLALWARRCVMNGTIDQIIDPYLMGKIAPECLRVFTMIADKCLHEKRNERPKMREVVWSLEFALELQESGDALKEGFNSGWAHREEVDEKFSLHGGGNRVHSCPEFWHKNNGFHQALQRCFSDKCYVTNFAPQCDALSDHVNRSSRRSTIEMPVSAVEMSSENIESEGSEHMHY